MKKTISITMALALAAVLSTTAFTAAANENIGVNAKYVEDIKTSKTISAGVVWGEMEFTYNVNGTKTWNAKTHEYDIDTKGEWSAKGNDISVTNHSNTAIDVDFTYEPLDEYKMVEGKFTHDGFTIPTAEEKAFDDEALTVSTALTLSGKLSSKVTTISSTILKNQNSKYLPHVLAGTYNFDPTDFVDSEKFTITQNGASWIVVEKLQRR